MLIQVCLLAAGLLLLLYAGDILVRGAVAAALKGGVSPLVAGIVVVGFGTSLPEVLVSVDAALNNSEALAHGNIVGSNIANLLLVLPIAAIIAPVATNAPGMDRSVTATIVATIMWIAVTFWLGLNPMIGAIFLLVLVGYITFIVRRAQTEVGAGADAISDDVDLDDAGLPAWKIAAFVLIGLAGLALGARLTINAGIAIADALGVSKALIGLTVVAIGTSLPEIGACVAASLRKQGEVVLGNVVGSNMFNVLAAGGAVSLVKSQTLAENFHLYSHWVMALATAVVGFFVFSNWKIGRSIGAVLLAGYLFYNIGLLTNFTLNDLPFFNA